MEESVGYILTVLAILDSLMRLYIADELRRELFATPGRQIFFDQSLWARMA